MHSSECCHYVFEAFDFLDEVLLDIYRGIYFSNSGLSMVKISIRYREVSLHMSMRSFEKMRHNHTSWVGVVRPKSVRNRCVIELFVALFVSSLCPFDISAGVEAFVKGLSQISFSHKSLS